MIELIASTFVNLMTSWSLFYLLLGVLLGLVVGILPALGTTAGMALLVPFVFGMEPNAALSMMVGLLAVVATGDTVASILIGVPGGAASQATVLDGFPMAKKGEAARALSAAYFASMIGGVFGAMVLTVAIVFARPVILAFGTGEMLLLVVIGLTMVSILSGPSLLKGVIAAGLGMFFGSIGAAPATGDYRMTLGATYLSDGLQIGVVALAVFAVPEIIDLLRRGSAISNVATIGQGWKLGIIDTLRNKWLVLRCSVIGCIIGALPIGGSDWIAYGHTVQSSKPRDQFGKGDVRGVIGPEAANNANSGGALVPTLLFGIPGSGPTAVLLGGLILLGIEPGPAMLDKHLGLTYTMIWSLAIANVMGTGICFMLSSQMARITTIPFVYVAPFLLIIVLFGAFQSSQSWGDLVSLAALGCVGIFLRRFGYSRPAFLVGFILSRVFEALLYQTVQIYSLQSLAERPLMWVLLAVAIASLVFGVKYRPKLATEGTSGIVERGDRAPQMIFVGAVIAVALFVLYSVHSYAFIGKIFPMTIAAMTLVACVIALAALSRTHATSMSFDSEAEWRSRPESYQTDLYHYLIWLGALIVGVYLIGFLAAIATFFVVFLRAKSNATWRQVLLMMALAIGLLALTAYFFELDLPVGLLDGAIMQALRSE